MVVVESGCDGDQMRKNIQSPTTAATNSMEPKKIMGRGANQAGREAALGGGASARSTG
jgi:hypothetical protein